MWGLRAQASKLLSFPENSSTNYKFEGVPEITLRFHNSLEGLTERTESYYIHGYPLLWGKDTLNSAKGSNIQGRVWESSKCEVSVVFKMYYSPSNDVWQYALSISNKQAYPSFGVQSFYWDCIIWVWLIDGTIACVVVLSL